MSDEKTEEKLYMHKWLQDDAVNLDLTTEEIIQALCEENVELEKDNKSLKAQMKVLAERTMEICEADDIYGGGGDPAILLCREIRDYQKEGK